jgi:hypothetical protein
MEDLPPFVLEPVPLAWPHLRAAVVLSVVLHGSLLLALTFWEQKTEPQSQLSRPHVLKVVLQVAKPSKVATEENTSSVVSNNIQTPGEDIIASSSSVIPQQASARINTSELVTEQKPMPERSASTAQSAAPTTAAPSPIDAVSLQQSINTAVQALRPQIQADWLAECQRHRNRHATQRCPQSPEFSQSAQQETINSNTHVMFYNWGGGHDANDTKLDALQNKAAFLQPLTEADGVLGAVARESRDNASAQYAYIFQNKQEHLASLNVLNAVSLTPKGLVMFGGLLNISFTGKDKVKFFERQRVPAVLYKETVITQLVKPATSTAEFKLKEPVFNGQ